MKGWRWGISGDSRPSPAVPVNLAPLKVRRRGNPEEQAAAPAALPAVLQSQSLSAEHLSLQFSLRTRPQLFTVAISHTHPAYQSVTHPRPSPGRVNTLSIPHAAIRIATLSLSTRIPQPLEAAS